MFLLYSQRNLPKSCTLHGHRDWLKASSPFMCLAFFQLYAENNRRGGDSRARMTRRALRALLTDLQQVIPVLMSSQLVSVISTCCCCHYFHSINSSFCSKADPCLCLPLHWTVSFPAWATFVFQNSSNGQLKQKVYLGSLLWKLQPMISCFWAVRNGNMVMGTWVRGTWSSHAGQERGRD